jgi:hypothetical protein
MSEDEWEDDDMGNTWLGPFSSEFYEQYQKYEDLQEENAEILFNAEKMMQEYPRENDLLKKKLKLKHPKIREYFTSIIYNEPYSLSKDDIKVLVNKIKENGDIEDYLLNFVLGVDENLWQSLVNLYEKENGLTKQFMEYMKIAKPVAELKSKLHKKRVREDDESNMEVDEFNQRMQKRNREEEENWEKRMMQKRNREEEVENWENKKSKYIYEENPMLTHWENEFDESIIDFFSLPMEKLTVKSQLNKLGIDKKKYIFEMILHSNSFKNLSDQEQRKQLIQILQHLS